MTRSPQSRDSRPLTYFHQPPIEFPQNPDDYPTKLYNIFVKTSFAKNYVCLWTYFSFDYFIYFIYPVENCEVTKLRLKFHREGGEDENCWDSRREFKKWNDDKVRKTTSRLEEKKAHNSGIQKAVYFYRAPCESIYSRPESDPWPFSSSTAFVP